MINSDITEYDSYIYKHLTELGVPFYIGIASQSSEDIKNEVFNRAYQKGKYRRSKEWLEVYKNNPNYTTEIIVDQIPWNDAIINEIKLISFYGRRDLRTGVLVNKTCGGEGVKELSEEAREKLRKFHTGLKASEQTLKNMSIAQKGLDHSHYGTRKGQKQSEETKRKIRLKSMGRVRSKESIEKYIKTKKGFKYKPTTEENKELRRKKLVKWGNEKLNYQKAMKIRELLLSKSIKEISVIYNVDYETIRNIKNNVTWNF